MQQTTFQISKMDCSAEEQMIRMKLDGLATIQGLDFDIPHRQLIVYHSGNPDVIIQRINSLQFDASVINSTEVNNFNIIDNKSRERKLLMQVLTINLLFFIVELTAGFIASSMGLVADSLDMLADSIIYGLALWAVGRAISTKKNIAKVAGYFQLALAAFGSIEVIRRFVGHGPIPYYQTMIFISILALIANGTCLYLLQKSKNKEAHIRASSICTSNDVIVNSGVILAGVLVFLTSSRYPDLIIGIIVFVVVGQGAVKMLKL